MASRTPRGLRLNNPLNIRKSSDVFQGEVTSSDKEFKQFKTAAYGYRAAMRILKNYLVRYSLDTIEKIIGRWAPQSENNTSRYVEVVEKRSGILRDKKLCLDEAETVAIVAAMSYMENGKEAEMCDVRKGWELL